MSQNKIFENPTAPLTDDCDPEYLKCILERYAYRYLADQYNHTDIRFVWRDTPLDGHLFLECGDPAWPMFGESVPSDPLPGRHPMRHFLSKIFCLDISIAVDPFPKDQGYRLTVAVGQCPACKRVHAIAEKPDRLW